MFPSSLLPHLRPSRRSAALSARLAALLGAATTLLAATLTACGGGTSQYEPFVPLRMFAFGDEASALTTDAPAGRNYSINGINGNNTADTTADDFLDCSLQPNWAQSMASYYGFAFAECNPGNVAAPQALNRAAPGARVAEVAQQVDAQAAAGGFRDKDISTVMVGVNDIVELYRSYDGSNEPALLAEARERGNRAAAIVNRLIALSSKVVVSNIPDMGYSPFAQKENVSHPGEDRAGLISRLSSAFNERLGVGILLDGRYVGLAQTDQRMLVIYRQPGSFAMTNVVDAACATPPPACTTITLIPGANPSTFLWASDLWLSWRGQSEIASLAITRAQRNPF